MWLPQILILILPAHIRCRSSISVKPGRWKLLLAKLCPNPENHNLNIRSLENLITSIDAVWLCSILNPDFRLTGIVLSAWLDGRSEQIRISNSVCATGRFVLCIVFLLKHMVGSTGWKIRAITRPTYRHINIRAFGGIRVFRRQLLPRSSGLKWPAEDAVSLYTLKDKECLFPSRLSPFGAPTAEVKLKLSV
jgi:hypothetical protein